MRSKSWWRRPSRVGPLVIAIALATAAPLFATNVLPRPGRDARGTHASVPPVVPAKSQKPVEAASPSIVLGPDGVQSSQIIAENNLPGTTAWQVSNPPATGSIAGFDNPSYAAAGQPVDLYVTTTAPTFQVFAYRMGWYHGAGAREVWTSPILTGRDQPACPVTPGINMVSCGNWTKSLTLTITPAFVQGDYLLKLVGSGNEQGYIPLTVWDPNSTAAYLVVSRSLTEEGWNTYGGYSFYQGNGPCTLGQTGGYPACNRARVVSFDRPYDTGYGASDFLSNEYPLIEYMEKRGLDVAYVTDVTLNADPSIVLHHRALLSLGHDETWTYNDKLAAELARAHGVNIVFFGAAAILRHSRLEPSSLGPDRQEVDYRNAAEDPMSGRGNPNEVTSNTWEGPPTNWSSTAFIGGEYSGYLSAGYSVPFVVYDSKAWIFNGTGLAGGAQVPGLLESDFDHIAPLQPTPSNLEVLGHSPIPLSESFTSQGEWGGYTYSDMTYYTDQHSQAGVFDTGIVSWISSLLPCPATQTACPAKVVEEMTGNLLWLFGQGPAGNLVPSVGNWKSVLPMGS